jgi:hypothetical protein
MSKNRKDTHQTGWIQPPTVPFGGSQFDHKFAEHRKHKSALREVLKEIEETQKKESI